MTLHVWQHYMFGDDADDEDDEVLPHLPDTKAAGGGSIAARV